MIHSKSGREKLKELAQLRIRPQSMEKFTIGDSYFSIRSFV